MRHLLLAAFLITVLGAGLFTIVSDSLLTSTLYKQQDFNDAYPTTSSTLREEVAKEVFRLIASLVGPLESHTLHHIKHALQFTDSDLTSILSELLHFQSTYRCVNCTDHRVAPRTVLGANTRLDHPQTWRGLSLPVLSVEAYGRLGNQMGQYATLYAIHRIYNASAVLTPKYDNRVRPQFPYLSLNALIDGPDAWLNLKRDNVNVFVSQELAATGLLGPHHFMFQGPSFELHLFNAYRDVIRREFTFNEKLLSSSYAFLSNVSSHASRNGGQSSTLTYVSVHIRSTDYYNHMKIVFGLNSINYVSYLRRAVRYYLKHYFNNVVFVVSSDDIATAQDIFRKIRKKNVFFATGGSPARDMALLSQCNHSIITLGSYGFWTGFLGRGTTVYPDVVTPKPYPFSRPFYERAGLQDFVPLLF